MWRFAPLFIPEGPMPLFWKHGVIARLPAGKEPEGYRDGFQKTDVVSWSCSRTFELNEQSSNIPSGPVCFTLPDYSNTLFFHFDKKIKKKKMSATDLWEGLNARGGGGISCVFWHQLLGDLLTPPALFADCCSS